MLRPHLIFAIVSMALTTLPLPAATTAPLGLTRLRPQSPRLAALLARGRHRSATMRALTDRVEDGDVVVYVETSFRIERDVVACVTWMATVPDARYLRVSLRPNLREAEAIAMLAHELQHVVEVIDHPEVTSPDALAALYARIGHRSSSTGLNWDTQAALRAGAAARQEIVRSA